MALYSPILLKLAKLKPQILLKLTKTSSQTCMPQIYDIAITETSSDSVCNTNPPTIEEMT
jgi:hypothetical protein